MAQLPTEASYHSCRAGPAVFGAEDGYRFFRGVGVGEDFSLHEVVAGLFDFHVADQGGDHGFVDALGARGGHRIAQEFGEYHGWGDDGVPIADHQGVDALFAQGQFDGGLVGGGGFAAGDVHGVARGAEGRDVFAEGGVEVVRHGHEREVVVGAGIGEQHAGAAGTGEDEHVLAPGVGQHLQAAGELKHVVQALGADDAALLEHGIVDAIIPGQCAGVGICCPRAHRGAPGLEHHHGFLQRYAVCHFREGAPVLEVFHVHGDDVGVGVLLEEREQVVFVDVGLVAEADDGGNPHFCRAAEADDGHADAAALGRKRHLALLVVGRAEGGAKVFVGVVEAVDVRPHEAHVVLLSHPDDLSLQLVFADFGEARGDEHGPGNVLLPAFRKHVRNEGGGDAEHGHVDVARYFGDAGVALAPQDFLGLGMDGVDLALVAAVDEVFHYRVADLAVFGGGTDHGHGVRLHDALHGGEDVGVARSMARRRWVEVEQHARVHGHGILGGGEHRVQVEFANLRKIVHEQAHVLDQRSDGGAVDALAAAHAVEHLAAPDVVHHGLRFGRRSGC